MDFSLEGRKGQPLARVDGSRGKGFNISSTHVHHTRGKKESTLDPPKQNKTKQGKPKSCIRTVLKTARCSGVSPSWLPELMLAPFSTRSLIISVASPTTAGPSLLLPRERERREWGGGDLCNITGTAPQEKKTEKNPQRGWDV